MNNSYHRVCNYKNSPSDSLFRRVLIGYICPIRCLFSVMGGVVSVLKCDLTALFRFMRAYPV